MKRYTAAQWAAVLVAGGGERVTLSELTDRLRRIGYRLDRSMDARGDARVLTGGHAGAVYPCLTTGIAQADDGVSAFNVDARRDSGYSALRGMRGGAVFAVVRGYVMEL